MWRTSPGPWRRVFQRAARLPSHGTPICTVSSSASEYGPHLEDRRHAELLGLAPVHDDPGDRQEPMILTYIIHPSEQDDSDWCWKLELVDEFRISNPKVTITLIEGGGSRVLKSNQADEEIRTLDPLLGKEMLYH